MKKLTKDLILAICLIAYVLILALAYTKMNIDRLSKDIEVFAGVFLVLGLLGLEKAYKLDEGKIAITAIELLVMSFYSLSIMHIVALIKCDFINYMFFSAGGIAIYYLIKEIIIFTKQKKEDLKNLSDISEIVRKEEPIKKEAKKRNKENKIENKNDNLDAKKKKEKSQNNKTIENKVKKEDNNKATTKNIPIKKTDTKKVEKTEQNKSEKEIKPKRKKSESKENNQSKKTSQKPKRTSNTKKKSKKEVKEND